MKKNQWPDHMFGCVLLAVPFFLLGFVFWTMYWRPPVSPPTKPEPISLEERGRRAGSGTSEFGRGFFKGAVDKLREKGNGTP